jgi:hypothetical protein
MRLRPKLNAFTLVVVLFSFSVVISFFTTFHFDQDLRGKLPAESTEDHPPLLLAASRPVDVDDSSTTSNVTTTTSVSGNHWRPSREWIDGCVRELEASKLEPFKVLWRRYVLGDCIKQCRNCYMLKCVRHPEKTKQKGSGCYQKTPRNDTFAALYHFRACKANRPEVDGNLTIVDQILKEAEQRDPGFLKPPPDTLVMHLRLGDVIENSKSTVADMLAVGGDPWHTDTYKSAIKRIDEYLSDIEASGLSKIVIRGGSHDPNYYEKSRVYAGCLSRAIQSAGYTSLSTQLEGSDPDHDFYFIGWAKHLSVSSGGFSRLMGTMAKRHGGRMVGREFIKYHLDNSSSTSTTSPPV